MKPFPEYSIVSWIQQKKILLGTCIFLFCFCFFLPRLGAKELFFVITFDTPASEKRHDNKKVRMTNLEVMSSQALESQYRSFKVKGLREAITNYLDCNN